MKHLKLKQSKLGLDLQHLYNLNLPRNSFKRIHFHLRISLAKELKLRNAAASLMEAIYLPYIHSPSFLNKITFAVYPAENYISQLPLQKEVANET